jgi:hypothetical protein
LLIYLNLSKRSGFFKDFIQKLAKIHSIFSHNLAKMYEFFNQILTEIHSIFSQNLDLKNPSRLEKQIKRARRAIEYSRQLTVAALRALLKMGLAVFFQHRSTIQIILLTFDNIVFFF